MRHRPILLLLTALLITGCGGTESEPAATPEAEETPTPEQSAAPDTPQAFIDALDAAMVREGQVLHTTVTATGGEAGGEPEDLWTDELWIYAAEDSARHLFHRAPENSEELDTEITFITVGEVTFSDSGGSEIDGGSGPPARGCPLVDTPSIVYVTVNLFCARYTPQDYEVTDLSAEVDSNATFEEQPALALAYRARNEIDADATPEPETLPPLIVSTFYADRETMLPLGWTVDIYATPEEIEGTTTGRYTNEFIDRDELANDFFSPVTLIEPEPTVPLYWLGAKLDPGGELSPIAPNEINLSQAPQAQPAFQVHLTYGTVSRNLADRFTEIDIQQWARADWEAVLDEGLIAKDLWLYPCAEPQPVEFEDGDATIFLTYEPEPLGPLPGEDGNCPDYEPDRFVGIVYFDQTVLLINGPYGDELHPRSSGETGDPYNSLEGVRAIIDGLQPLGDEGPVASSNPTKSAVIETPTIEEVYSGLATTLAETGEDMVLHKTESTTGEATGFMETEITTQTWVDGSVPVARTESEGHWEYIEGEYVEEGITREAINRSIILGRSAYRTSEGDFEPNEPNAVEAEGCYGQPEAIATVIGCPGPTETSTTTVEWDEYDGQQALVLVTEGTTHGSDEVSDFVRRTYLDPDTFLPIFAEQEGAFSIGADFSETFTTQFEHEFIERSSLPEDFFEPSAIGYTEPDPAARIDESFDTPVYWLGEDFEPVGDLPSLTLWGVSGSPEGAPIYDGYIDYSLADNPHGPPVIMLEIWSASDWNELGSTQVLNGFAGRPCNSNETLPAPEDAKATLYRWVDQDFGPDAPTPEDQPDCDVAGTTRYGAVIEFPETVVVVDAPPSSSPANGVDPNPYNNPTGMQAIVDGIELR